MDGQEQVRLEVDLGVCRSLASALEEKRAPVSR